jgi:hypothetical protein
VVCSVIIPHTLEDISRPPNELVWGIASSLPGRAIHAQAEGAIEHFKKISLPTVQKSRRIRASSAEAPRSLAASTE